MEKAKKILVTGGAGFLGSHLCYALLEHGYHVTALDNMYTGNLTTLMMLRKHENFAFIERDVTDPFDEKFDIIFNFACPASPVHYQKDPIKTTKTSVLGALNMLDLAMKNGACIIQASTSEVYGDPLEHPQAERYWGNVNPIGIRSCYDEGKRCAESLFFDYHRVYGIDIKVVRIFNTYGPRMNMDDGRVVSNFIVQALKNEPITLYGSGTQTRSFCYVDDLIDGIIRMAQSDTAITGPINLGNPHEFTLLDLAHKIVALTKSSSKLIFKPLPDDDPKRRCPDIDTARRLLNWEPKISLDDGLIRTIEYFAGIIS